MIDDRQTCDVCGEEFNEERPSHEHVDKKKQESAKPTEESGVDEKDIPAQS